MAAENWIDLRLSNLTASAVPFKNFVETRFATLGEYLNQLLVMPRFCGPSVDLP